MEREVQTTDGERFVTYGDTDEGVLTCCDTIPWEDVTGFWTWHAGAQRRMFVPVD